MAKKKKNKLILNNLPVFKEMSDECFKIDSIFMPIVQSDKSENFKQLELLTKQFTFISQTRVKNRNLHLTAVHEKIKNLIEFS